MVESQILFGPAVEAVTLVGDSAQDSDFLSEIQYLDRWIRPNWMPATSMDGLYVFRESIHHNDHRSVVDQLVPFTSTVCSNSSIFSGSAL